MLKGDRTMDLFKEYGKTADEILSDISEAICLNDDVIYDREITKPDGLGDRLYEDIAILRRLFGMED